MNHHSSRSPSAERPPDLNDFLRASSRSVSPQPPKDTSALPKLGSMDVEPGTNYLIHVLQTNDTIAGIALTYGVTVESIKRQNKLYSTATNSLFLRQSLVIPTTKEQVRQHLGSISRQKREKQELQEEAIHLVMKETGATREVALSFIKQAGCNIDEAIEKLQLSQVVHEHALRAKNARRPLSDAGESSSLASYGSTYHNSFGYRKTPGLAEESVSRVPRQKQEQLASAHNSIYGL
eukprot:TRINITY_DN1283_c0_g5_i1.p1 TRINITY_DN1283_c0_g5~~TRINITY_DN1283_c0_g5_i1.p1  ORF type:complete len:256 (-),score=40.91 TRINITY_DN1283_c0_g5_i1:168-875(-)